MEERGRSETFVVGVDFGTLSGRAVVVRASDGAELGTAVYRVSARGDRGGAARHGREAAAGVGAAGPGGLPRRAQARGAGSDPARGRGPRERRRDRHRLHGLDADAGPARRDAAVRGRRVPRAPARVSEAVEAPRRAGAGRARHRARPSRGSRRYGGRISSEWEFAKALQVLEEDPEVYGAMDRWIEAADWIVWQLCGAETRNVCTAGYKGIFQDGSLSVAASTARRCTPTSRTSWPTSSSTRCRRWAQRQAA